MGFEIGVADHVVKGEGVRADDIAEVCVCHAACSAPLKPPRHERDHGVCFATVAREAAHEVRAFACFSAIAGNESGDDDAIECRDEDFDVLRVCRDVAFGEIEKCCMQRSRDLRVRHHLLDIGDGAKAKL